MNTAETDLLRLDDVTKLFPGVRALSEVSFTVRAGEVHGLVGENGAGKSTLMGVASGALIPEGGTVTLCGSLLRGGPGEARELGLAIVRQEPALMPDLSVAENLYLGVPRAMRPPMGNLSAWARNALQQWSSEVSIAPDARVNTLNSEGRFIVEIVKALAGDPRVLVLDEPTEHLQGEDVARLFKHIRDLTSRGASVVYISHRIREVQQIASRITVLRDGQGQGTYDAATLNEQRIVELIVGAEVNREFPLKSEGTRERPVVLRAAGLSGEGFFDVSLLAKKGEIIGLAGIDGNGQREFLQALAGMRPSRGVVQVKGVDVSLRHAGAAASSGIRLVPGDRHRDGIFSELSVRENFSVRSLAKNVKNGLMHARSENTRAGEAVKNFAVKTPSIETPIQSLSGGNQQKLVMASVLASEPLVLLVDEPTQGVDIGARMEIYQHLRAAADSGIAVLILSSDANEVAGLSDRVMIFSRGKIIKQLEGAEVSENGITQAVMTSTSVRDKNVVGTRGLWKWAAGDEAPILLLAAAVLLLGVLAASVNDFYLTAQNWSGVFPLIATLALVAFGQQLLMLVGGIDLSVGPLIGLILSVESFFLVSGASPTTQAAGWALVLVIAGVVGMVNWFLVDPAGLHPMVATLITYMGLQALALMLRPVPDGIIADEVMDGITASIGIVPLSLLGVIALGVFLEFGLFRRRWGLAFRGFGSRPESARVAGVRPRIILLLAYVGCSMLAGLAAVLMIAQVGTGDPSAGQSYTLASIAAAVIGGASLFGGRGSFLGALLGALLITQVQVVTTFLHLRDGWQSYLLGGMILGSVALYSKSRQMAVAA